MNKLEHFMLPEQSNSLYTKEAISSISLTRDIAEKINELIDSYNELSKLDLEWKQEQEGTIRKGVIYMKDNLLNSINDLLNAVGLDFIDTKIKNYTTILKSQIDNLISEYESVSSGEKDEELIDGRVSYDGSGYKTIGEHIRIVTNTIKDLIDNLEIEYYTKEDLYINIKSNTSKTEGAFFRIPDSDIVSSDLWNCYILDVQPKEKYRIKTYTVSAGRCVAFISEPLTASDRNLAFDYIPETSSSGEIMEFTVEVPDNAIQMIVNENPTECECIIGKCYGYKYVKTESENNDYLTGKTLICCGDSITEGANPDGDYFTNYAELVALRHKMICVKDGVGGSTISNIGNGKSFTEERYLKHTDFDYLTIWFGWNDNAYSELGTINDEVDTTFYGAYNKVLAHYITNYPTKKIGIIVPYVDNQEIQNAVRELSIKFGVPCLDLADSNKCSLLWGTENEFNLARRNALTYDGLHPNQDGYNFLSTMYEQFLLSL